MSAPFILSIVDPCPTTTINLTSTSPFVDKTYILQDPQLDIPWAGDAALGTVGISPKSCGSFLVTFWHLDAFNVQIKDVTTPVANPLLTVNTVTQMISVLNTNGVTNVGQYRIAYKIALSSYPAIPSAISVPFILTIIDPCDTTTLVLANPSPFADVTYNL